MSRVIHFKSEDEVIWSDTHTEAAHFVILKGDKPYRYATEAAHYVILKGHKPYRYAY